MKAAFLLTTAAWFSGGQAAPPAAPAAKPAPIMTAPAAPAPITSAPIVASPMPGGSCNGPGCGGTIVQGSDCGCGCDCIEAKPSLLDRLRAMFSRPQPIDCCECCGSSVPAGAPIAPIAPIPAPAPAHSSIITPAPASTSYIQPSFEENRGLFGRLFGRRNADYIEAPISSTIVPNAMPSSPTIAGPIATVPAKPGAELIQKPTQELGRPMPPAKTTLMPPAVEMAPPSSKVIETENKHPF